MKDKSNLTIFRSKLKELDSKLNAYRQSLDKMFKIKTKYPYNIDGYTIKDLYGKLFMVMIKQQQNKINKLESEIKKFLWLKNKALGRENKEQFDMELIKSFPIGNLMTTQPTGKSSNRVYYLCPLHNEDHASFVWYKEQNTYWCYGESAGGDVIDLFQKLNNCDFKSACKYLSQ